MFIHFILFLFCQCHIVPWALSRENQQLNLLWQAQGSLAWKTVVLLIVRACGNPGLYQAAGFYTLQPWLGVQACLCNYLSLGSCLVPQALEHGVRVLLTDSVLLTLWHTEIRHQDQQEPEMIKIPFGKHISLHCALLQKLFSSELLFLCQRGPWDKGHNTGEKRGFRWIWEAWEVLCLLL